MRRLADHRRADHHGGGAFAGDEAIGVLAGEQAFATLKGGQGRAGEEGVDAGNQYMAMTLLMNQFPRIEQGDRAADPATRDDIGAAMKVQAQLPFDAVQQADIQPFQPAGALGFGQAQEQGRLLRGATRYAAQGFGDGTGGHPDQLGAAAPGMLQRHLGRDLPFTAPVDEAGFLEVVEGAADGGAAGRRVEPDGADHAGAEDADSGHHWLSSGSRLDFTSADRDG
ncbi:hypothetical protein D9M71_452970 [compost metagenome]